MRRLGTTVIFLLACGFIQFASIQVAGVTASMKIGTRKGSLETKTKDDKDEHKVTEVRYMDEPFSCYVCNSSEFKVDKDCENPSFVTTRQDNCPMCHVIFNKNPISTDPLIIRACMSKEKLQASVYGDEKRFRTVSCVENLCNSDGFHIVDITSVPGSQSLKERERICYECNSEQHANCSDINEYVTEISKLSCQNKPCVSMYSRRSKSIKRECLEYDEIRVLISNDVADLTIEWCEKDRCNLRSITSFPGCKNSNITGMNEWGGCIEIGIDKPIRTWPKKTTLKPDQATYLTEPPENTLNQLANRDSERAIKIFSFLIIFFIAVITTILV